MTLRMLVYTTSLRKYMYKSHSQGNTSKIYKIVHWLYKVNNFWAFGCQTAAFDE